MYYLEAGIDKHNRLRNALLAALIAHAALILGISFELDSGPGYNTQIEVTLAHRPSTAQPEDAQHVAQSNQAGSGNQSQFDELTRSELPSQGEGQTEQFTPPLPTPDSSVQREQAVTSRSQSSHMAYRDQLEKDQPTEQLKGISPELDQLTDELAHLQAELDQASRNLSSSPRTRRLNAVAARESADATYLYSFLNRLEAVGNRYYPEASVRYGIFGRLKLLVVINQDGSLEETRVLSSSGYAVLDEAAIKTVRMAAPFAPFPAELRATTDRLEIVRTWHFEENRLSSD